MTRKLAQNLVIVACAVALMLMPLASIAPTGASDAPNSFHWARKQTPFTVQAGDNVSSDWQSILRRAISDWNKSDAVTIKEVAGGTGAQNCAPTTGMIEVCNFLYGTQEGWLGLTRLYFNTRGDHVEAATVQMNDSFFNQKNGQYNNDAARQHTMCHEMGHAIGLDHVDSSSCMNASQFAVFNQVTPVNKDYRQLDRIYDHKDSTTTVAGSQKKEKKDKKNRKDKKNKKDTGKKNQSKEDSRDVRKKEARDRKRAARESLGAESFFDPTSLPSVPSGLESDETVTVQRLDDGRTVVTYITWAEE